MTVKWAWYEKDKQFFQAFIAAAPGNEIIKKSLSIMLEPLNGTRAKRGGGEMHMIGTQAMQDAWAELAPESHGKNEEVYLLSEHRIGEYQGSSSYVKLPTQTNGGDAGYTDITCNFVVADDERRICLLLLQSHSRSRVLWQAVVRTMKSLEANSRTFL